VLFSFLTFCRIDLNSFLSQPFHGMGQYLEKTSLHTLVSVPQALPGNIILKPVNQDIRGYD